MVILYGGVAVLFVCIKRRRIEKRDGYVIVTFGSRILGDPSPQADVEKKESWYC
jgi:hypothetical protein